jgi:predicted HicB family RNase H-like nuclease
MKKYTMYLGLYVNPKLHKSIVSRAKKEKVSQSEWVRQAIQEKVSNGYKS